MCVEKFFCVWVNKTSEHTIRKVYCFKRLWSERNDWIWLHLFINDKTRPSWHIIRRTSKQVTYWGVKQPTVIWIATWLGRGLSCSRCQVASCAVKQSTYVTQTETDRQIDRETDRQRQRGVSTQLFFAVISAVISICKGERGVSIQGCAVINICNMFAVHYIDKQNLGTLEFVLFTQQIFDPLIKDWYHGHPPNLIHRLLAKW